MSRYDFKDAAEPYLAWARKIPEDIRKDVGDIAAYIASNKKSSKEFFEETGAPAGSTIRGLGTIIVVRFPDSPVHLSIPMEREGHSRELKHNTIHITVDKPAPKVETKPFRQYYSLPNLEVKTFDNPEERPMLLSASSVRSTTAKSTPGMPQRPGKGGRTRRFVKRR